MVVANGDHVACRGLARDVVIHIVDEYFSVDCYAIPVNCCNLVLGVKFLRTLAPILWDFDDLCMAFLHHGWWILWKGLGSSCTNIPPTAHLHSMRALEPASRPSATAITVSIYYRALRRSQFDHTTTPNSRRTSWRHSARPC